MKLAEIDIENAKAVMVEEGLKWYPSGEHPAILLKLNTSSMTKDMMAMYRYITDALIGEGLVEDMDG